MENFTITKKFGNEENWFYIEFISAGAEYYCFSDIAWDKIQISICEDRGLDNNPQLAWGIYDKPENLENFMLEQIDTFCVWDI